MTFHYLIFVLLAAASAGSVAQGVIYRCGNEYTNNVSEERAKSCTVFSGGNVTIVQSPKSVAPAAAGGSAANSAGNTAGATAGNSAGRSSPAPASAARVDSADQRAKDSDARLILEAELRKAEARQLELQREYNNGEPEKLGPETRNYQKYLDRLAGIKASLSRNESDIAGIRRELGRLPAPQARQ